MACNVTTEALLHVSPCDVREVAARLTEFAEAYEAGEEPYDDIGTVVNFSNTSGLFTLPDIELDISDTRSEKIHTFDSAALLLIMALLFLTVITIWVFKARRLRVFHETGLSLIYGVIVGLILNFAFPPSESLLYDLACPQYECDGVAASRCRGISSFQIGEDIQLRAAGGSQCSGDHQEDDNVVIAEVLGKVFKDRHGNYIEQTLLFNPELFFFALLPPIIFQAGFSLQKRHFFRNLGSLLLYAFAGTTISTFVIGGLMYGYTKTGLEVAGSSFATATGKPIPNEFKETIIPSLLFGSLISATDPVTVLAIFHDLHVDHDLYSLVFGESVMNDAVAIVMFSVPPGLVLAMLLNQNYFSIVAIFTGRIINIYILSFFLNLGRAKRIKFRFQHMLVFAGLRGAIAFALAIRNTQSPARQLIFTTTLVIVMATVLVCGGFTTLVLQCLRIKVGVKDDTGGLQVDGVEIPYNPKSGNWFIAKWSKLDKNYLIPLFTHYGRSVGLFLPQFCVTFCRSCRPTDLREEVSFIEEVSESEEEEEEEEDEDTKTLSFRHHSQGGDEEDGPEGDLGLGAADHGPSATYGSKGYHRLDESQESHL